MFEQILHITLPVFGIVAVGFVYGRFNEGNLDAANHINMLVFVPALLFFVLTEKIPDLNGLFLVGIATAIIVLGSGLAAMLAAKLSGIPGPALIPPTMFSNSGNLGIPLAALAFGDKFLPLAIIAFVVSTTLHFTLGLWYLSGKLSPINVLKNPVFLATLAGLSCNTMNWHTPAMLLPGLEMLSQVAIPLMLIALGVRLADINTAYWKTGLTGALLRPIAGIASAWITVTLLNIQDTPRDLLILFGALPPAVMNFLMAERFAQYPERVAPIVAMGNLGSLAVVPVVLFFII